MKKLIVISILTFCSLSHAEVVWQFDEGFLIYELIFPDEFEFHQQKEVIENLDGTKKISTVDYLEYATHGDAKALVARSVEKESGIIHLLGIWDEVNISSDGHCIVIPLPDFTESNSKTTFASIFLDPIDGPMLSMSFLNGNSYLYDSEILPPMSGQWSFSEAMKAMKQGSVVTAGAQKAISSITFGPEALSIRQIESSHLHHAEEPSENEAVGLCSDVLTR